MTELLGGSQCSPLVSRFHVAFLTHVIRGLSIQSQPAFEEGGLHSSVRPNIVDSCGSSNISLLDLLIELSPPTKSCATMQVKYLTFSRCLQGAFFDPDRFADP